MRTVEVAHDRLPRWLDGFVQRHGEAALEDGVLTGADGVTAAISSWHGLVGVASVEELLSRTAPPARLGLLLIRRGGYAVAVVDGERVLDRKVGRRHVQSRTAAGGWSQQRFARRRGHQADELVGAVTDHAARILSTTLDGLVRGGDRSLVAAVLDDPRLRAAAALPHRDLFDLPDPSPAVLATALSRARSVRIALSD